MTFAVHKNQGYTIFELLIVMAILGVLFSFGVLSVKGLNNDAGNAGSIIRASFLEVRAQALSTSSGRQVSLNAGKLIFRRVDDCASLANPQTLPTPELPSGVTLSAQGSNWNVCFVPRGTLQTSPIGPLTVMDGRGRTKTLTLYLTGSVILQ
ncbi:hypothetical protein GCM10022631_08420 [Deinococcus rubellus]|uniref:Type II secretion system GspH family protein n=1 Tax=Deinococcus rubellus TaxID=1889240 RepID=A0ABY5YHR7_9DEIO|nr:type II secretion system protein [Deinococcus rubellus]UWX64231.1 type II secretion system GspH family protein [Deinococcus rubellus]